MSASATIRPLDGLDELREAVALQETVWGEGFSERVPVSLLKVSVRLGGVVSGAFDEEGRLVGFVFGMTGLEDGRPVHWSDMLAVAPDIRNRGLGRRLKLHQRERLLALGVDRMYWTFDPLESRNAWLNLARLGATAREYVPDMYGPSDSPLHRGLGTDRLVALWELDSERVGDRLAGGAPPGLDDLPRAFGARSGPDGLVPEEPHTHRLDAPAFLVPIPADIQAIKATAPERAVRWREATRAALRPALDAGWEVRELVRDGELSWYRVERS